MRGATTLVAVLLSATTYQIDSLLPYKPASSQKCHNPEREYSMTMSDWCCSRCPPGSMLKVNCNETADSVCEPCPSGQYTDKWNYKTCCLSCHKCEEDKGLQYLQNCTTSTRPKCVCQPGMYCALGFEDPECKECNKYSLCKLGFGVSKQRTAESNVKCSRCPDGTFSDVVSHTETCKPHTRCQKAVVEQGNATSDTVCDPATPVYSTTPQSPTTETQSNVVYTTASTVVYTTSSLLKTSIPTKTDSTLTPIQSSHPATKPPASTNVKLVTVVAPSVIISCVLLIIILVVLWQSKIINRRGSQKRDLLTDTNGNSKMVEGIHHKYASDTQITSLAVHYHEQQCLMDTQEPCTGLSDAPDKPIAGREDTHVMEHDSLV
ncbi:unnamed protein product [Lota lota]